MTSGNSIKNQEDSINLNDLISLRTAGELSGLSISHLRLLVNKGDLWGTKIGRNWLTSMQAVKKYLEIDHKPGRKPKLEN